MRKFNVKITVTEEDGEILLNGFGPKTSIGKAYRTILHVIREDIQEEADRMQWLAVRTKSKLNDVNDLINRLTD